MIRLWHLLADLLFPRKCVLCQELLQRGETDICGNACQKPKIFLPPRPIPIFTNGLRCGIMKEMSGRVSCGLNSAMPGAMHPHTEGGLP